MIERGQQGEGEAGSASNPLIHHDSLIACVMDFNLTCRQQTLDPLKEYFILTDTDGDGLLSTQDLIKCCRLLVSKKKAMKDDMEVKEEEKSKGLRGLNRSIKAGSWTNTHTNSNTNTASKGGIEDRHALSPSAIANEPKKGEEGGVFGRMCAGGYRANTHRVITKDKNKDRSKSKSTPSRGLPLTSASASAFSSSSVFSDDQSGTVHPDEKERTQISVAEDSQDEGSAVLDLLYEHFSYELDTHYSRFSVTTAARIFTQVGII